MSLLSEFEEYKQRLNDSVADIMQHTVVKETKKEIVKQAGLLEYGETSRGTLKDEDNYHETYSRSGDTHTIVIEGSHVFQGAKWGNYLSTVVEQGWSNWNQPGPRPYMKRTEDIMKEKVDGIVASELNAKGL